MIHDTFIIVYVIKSQKHIGEKNKEPQYDDNYLSYQFQIAYSVA